MENLEFWVPYRLFGSIEAYAGGFGSIRSGLFGDLQHNCVIEIWGPRWKYSAAPTATMGTVENTTSANLRISMVASSPSVM